MLRSMDATAPADLYERDFYAWTQDQAARVRALGARNDGLDVENVAEEIESLGKSDRRAAESLLGQLLMHLAKLRFEPAQQPRAHWEAEVEEFRRELGRIFRDSPSLRARRHEMAEDEWRALTRRAAREQARTGERVYGVVAKLVDLPFDLDAEVLDEDWFPPSGG